MNRIINNKPLLIILLFFVMIFSGVMSINATSCRIAYMNSDSVESSGCSSYLQCKYQVLNESTIGSFEAYYKDVDKDGKLGVYFISHGNIRCQKKSNRWYYATGSAHIKCNGRWISTDYPFEVNCKI